MDHDAGRHGSHPAHHGQEADTSPAAHSFSGDDAHAGHDGHDAHAGHSVAMFRTKFWVSLALTVPTVIWGHMLAPLLGIHAPAFPGSRWIAPVFGTAVFLYGGRVFLDGAWRELERRLPGMMTLISLAIGVAFLFSLAVTLGYPGMPLWEELATLVTIMLLGHWIEMKSIAQAQGALQELAKLLPDTATRIVGDGTEEVSIDALAEGDLVLVRPGASIPADGIVKEGSSAVNEAMITGESKPVEKGEGDAVIAGTVNGSGSLRVQVTKTGERTALAGIMRLVGEAQSSRSRAQALADRAAFWLTIVALASGIVTLAVWLALEAEPAFAVERLVSVLVVACPHALGLAIPLVIAISTTLAARSGLLVRNRRGLEESREIDVVVFDKTGTLTRGEFRVVAVIASGLGEDEALALAAAVEADSEHTIAKGIVESAAEKGLSVAHAEAFEAIPGHGVRARVAGRDLSIGGLAHLAAEGVRLPAELDAAAADADRQGRTVVFLLEGDRPVAALAVADAIRPESFDAIDRLHAVGVEVAMLTGDSRAVAESVAKELGIDTVFAQVLPGQKVEKLNELKASGKRVAMVGDGVNDAPALLTADVGIAIGAGTDVAVEAGDIVLVRSDPRDVADAIELSKASYRKMVQNLVWAAGYNVVAIPLAAGVLAGRGILLQPAVAAILMSASTVVVAINAQLLRKRSRRPEEESDRRGSRSEGSAEKRARHWDRVWREREPNRVSWYQPRPGLSWELIERAGLPAGARVLDVGGGASALVDRLLDLGFRPGVLDISDQGLARARARLGARAELVEWFNADVTRWNSPHPWDLWHDRAVLHFLTEEADRQAYRATLLRSLRPGGFAVIAQFGPEGPTTCSGLPVRRWSSENLEAFLGPELTTEERASEEHVTPSGAIQKFLVCRLRRATGPASPM